MSRPAAANPVPPDPTVPDTGISALLDAYACARRTPSQVAEQVLGRVAALPAGPPVLVACDPERLRAEAELAGERWRAGDARALEGVPVVLERAVTPLRGRAPARPRSIRRRQEAGDR